MREALQILRPYLARYRRGFATGFTALAFRNLAGAAIPLLIGYAVDALTRSFTFHRALSLAALLIVLTAFKGLCQYRMRVTLIGISRDLEYDIRNDLYHHLIRLAGDFFSTYRTGDLMARATNDLNSVRMMLGPGIMYTVDTTLTALLAVAVMATVDWRLMLVTLAPAPLVSLLVVVFGRYIHVQFRRIQALFSDMSSRVQENLAGVRVVRAYVQEEAELRRFNELNQSYVRRNLKLARASALFMPALHSLTGLSFLLVLWYGGYRLLQGQITLGGFLMFNVYLGMLIWPMVAMGWVVNLVQRGTASLSRINELLQRQPSLVSPPAPRPLPRPLRGEIRFENVSLELSGTRILTDLNLRIPAGATVAVVGQTGSGKTSLVRLIPRLADPTAGLVRLEGIDLRDLDLQALRRQIGMVPQETFLFSATLAENIAFGTDHATEEEIRRAAEMAGLAEEIAGFPDGYQTLLGERGITLSGGQQQRTAIARALIRNPRILILDDALSSVDTVTEKNILNALTGIMRDRTTVLISHRVSTVRHADLIFVLAQGRIVEQGTHAQLLAANRHYADLYRKQLIEEELESI